MSHRKPYGGSSKRKPRWRDAVPRWNQTQIDTTNHLAQMLFQRLGIAGPKTYFEKLLPVIVICVVLGAAVGAHRDGFDGIIWYGIAGIAAPALLIWFAAVLPYALIYLGLFFAVWAALFYGVLWVFRH